ncbi:MAG: cytochrome c biogenesis protein CcsA [Myxococcales bacterium]|nr:cytochrome c biogenesis protein CcsA [Myxococcales bacterium]
MTFSAHGLALLCYALASAAGWASRRRPWAARPVAWLLGAGIVAHAFAFLGFHREVPPIPLESFPAALSLMGWLFAAAYLLSLGLTRVRDIGPWVATAALGFTALGDLGLRFLRFPGLGDSSGTWSHTHVLFSAAGFSLLALASLAGVGYLVKERSLKRKRDLPLPLPSLESLDRTESIALGLGFLLLTLGVGTGFLWATSFGERLWTGHTVFLLVSWVAYLLPVGQRVVLQQRGPQPARTVVIGFALLLVSYLGGRLVGGGV